ncbi:dynamin family protein [Pradoshia sp.]
MITHKSQNDLMYLYGIYQFFDRSGDRERSEKTREIMEKMYNNKYSLAFCGHFSAGKSTVINYMLGQPVLPSSPIPTSANIVRIESGNGEARITLADGRIVVFPPPINFSVMRDYAKNGAEIQSMNLRMEGFPFGERVALLDTPGIDSTDEAHERSTASSFHMADSVFYVTDYNHIQSEVNFQFTKDLTKMGKKLFIIINQIDKHDDRELPFSSIKESVKKAFHEWGVKPEEIYYTTMREENHPYNQAPKVKEKIEELASLPLKMDVPALVRRLVDEHIEWRNEQDQELYMNLSEQLAINEPDLMDSVEQASRLNKKIRSYIEEAKRRFEEKTAGILKNANLTPYETRELVREYLEANVTSFKIGFFGKQKTLQERERRRDILREDVKKQTDSTVIWHLQELFRELLAEYPGDRQKGMNLIQAFTYEIPYEEFLKTEPLAAMTGDLVLNFSDQLASHIRKSAQIQAKALADRLFGEWEQERESLYIPLAGKFKNMPNVSGVWERWQAAEKEQLAYEAKVKVELSKRPRFPLAEIEALIKPEEQVEVIIPKERENTGHEPESASQEVVDEPSLKNDAAVPPAKVIMSHLMKASQILDSVPGFQKQARELSARSLSFQNQTYTLALFGAFSAGKSSFANALLGANLLPVSPNPTTAVINRILPPSSEYGNGTAVIFAKTEKMLIDDLNGLWTDEGLKVQDLELAKRQAKALLAKKKEALGLRASFLEAFVNGIDGFKENLGEVFTVNIEEFAAYATDETKSCFIEKIDLYYDCELTRKGVILVDTPGADSINARHTGTSFNYIKHSDAICFITYYNHPFSRADRTFLDQLGRVKDSFSLDKMFFLLNAADLAADEQERELVVEYLDSQLRESGIRNPRIFPISSRSALQVRTGSEDQNARRFVHLFEKFERAIHQFIDDDLKSLLLAAGWAELQKVHHLLQQSVELANESEEKKLQRKESLEQNWEEIRKLLLEKGFAHEGERAKQEAMELLHYSKQRLGLNFPGVFKEYFHPGRITNDKQTLVKSMNLLLDDMKLVITNEWQAASLRLERTIEKMMRESYVMLAESAQAIQKDWSFSEPDFTLQQEFLQDSPLENVNANEFKDELKKFKGTNAFFEKDGRKQMEQSVYAKLEQKINEYYEQQQSRLIDYAENMIRTLGEQLTKSMLADGQEIVLGLKQTLEEQANPAVYDQAAKRLGTLLKSEKEDKSIDAYTRT